MLCQTDFGKSPCISASLTLDWLIMTEIAYQVSGMWCLHVQHKGNINVHGLVYKKGGQLSKDIASDNKLKSLMEEKVVSLLRKLHFCVMSVCYVCFGRC